MAIGATRELFGMVSPDKREDQPFAQNPMLDSPPSARDVAHGNLIAHPILPGTTMNSLLQPSVTGDSSKEQYSFAIPVRSIAPGSYPPVVNPSFGREFLRPFQQPLFDTEYFVPTKGIKELSFFCNPERQAFIHVDELKTKHDTNLLLAKMLDYPREFSILGFNAIIDPKVPQKDRDALLSNGALFEMHFDGKRPYLSVPFEHVCARKPAEKSFSQVIAESQLKTALPTPKESKEVDEETAQIQTAIKFFDKQFESSYHRFNLGKSAFKIKPAEEFHCTLSWKKTPLLSAPARITVEIIGLLWNTM